MSNHKSENQEQQKSQTDQDQTGSATKGARNKGVHSPGGRIMTTRSGAGNNKEGHLPTTMTLIEGDRCSTVFT